LAEDGSAGIRITSDPFCQQLIALTGKPIVSTSANFSGDPPPSIFPEINSEIRRLVDYVVNWRQHEKDPAQSSAIIKLEEGGGISIIRS
jgi:L-threonylcarbamoyladenylate synthase